VSRRRSAAVCWSRSRGGWTSGRKTLGVLVGGLKRVRAHDGSLNLVCTQQRILKIFRITGLTEVFGIYETVDQAIAARRGRR
jgi:anti-sigma B factor antagonist